MLLSSDNLAKLTQKQHHKNHTSGEEKILLYLYDQQLHAKYYTSPNSTCRSFSSIPSSFYAIVESTMDNNDEENLFYDSISQTMCRSPYHNINYKQQHTATIVNDRREHLVKSNVDKEAFPKPLVYSENQNNEQFYSHHRKVKRLKSEPISCTSTAVAAKRSPSLTQEQDQVIVGKGSKIHHNKKSNSKSPKVKGNTKNNLPKTTANGFHLLQAFSSPNLEINRISLKTRPSHQQPKLGIFNKGKSSAIAKEAVPELMFSESRFFKRPKPAQEVLIASTKDSTSHKKDSLLRSVDLETSKQTSISKFFQKQSSSHHEMDTVSTSYPSPKNRRQYVNVKTVGDTSIIPEKKYQSEESIKTSCIQPTKVYHYCNDFISRGGRELETRRAFNNNNKRRWSVISSQDSSNASLVRLIEECKRIPEFYHSSSASDEYQQQQQQVPSYSFVRTPPTSMSHQQHQRNNNGSNKSNSVSNSIGVFVPPTDDLYSIMGESNLRNPFLSQTFSILLSHASNLLYSKDNSDSSISLDWQLYKNNNNNESNYLQKITATFPCLDDSNSNYMQDFWKSQFKRTL